GSYDFILTARDADINGGGTVDKFRMKITNHANGALVYDNQFGSPDTSVASTALAGGSIVIHPTPSGKNVGSTASALSGDGSESPGAESGAGSPDGMTLPLEYMLGQNAPNPF